jgi:hypothetical protein
MNEEPRQSPMGDDEIIGDGGNVTVYMRPDGSRYALDKSGRGTEWSADAAIFGRARFDSRDLATGIWDGSRSLEPDSGQPEPKISSVRSARRRGGGFSAR